MPDDNDWRRRFTEQDLDEEPDNRPRRRAPQPQPAQEEAEDPNVIRVLVDERGAVSDVIIPARWQDTVEARDLGQALREKANEAIANRIAVQLEDLDLDAESQPVFAHRDAPSAHGDPDSPVAQSLLTEVMDLFARIDTDLATYAAQMRQAATATYSGAGVNSRISVTMAHGQVTGVAVDQRWLHGARHTEIRAEALSAFQAAWRQVTTTGAGAVRVPPALARLQELASDPEALSRQLGSLR
jgi:hypothetical protein